jgi:hypothetical protein
VAAFKANIFDPVPDKPFDPSGFGAYGNGANDAYYSAQVRPIRAAADAPNYAAQAKDFAPYNFGAYGNAANDPYKLTLALDKPPASKINGSLDFTDSSKRWLKDLGLTTTNPITFHRTWETEREKDARAHRKWSDTYSGRLAIRSISRGIVGASFFAAANMYAGKALKNYTPDNASGVLPTIAKFIDNTAGKAISGTVKFVTGDAEKAAKSVIFRDTRYLGMGHGKDGKQIFGRTLGSEVVHVTFDFAAMSFSDYMTRYVLGLLDPNARKEWMKNGHIDVPGALKDVFKNVFRGVTYAAGEDMAVAIPYVYGLRLQRNMIDHFSPGFKYDSDRGLNGGSLKAKNEKIVGDYQLEGALDLMGRFSWYNVGTKMFRDAYSKAETKLDRWWEGDRKLHLPTVDPKSLTASGILHSVTGGINYVVRTTFKVMAYMIPATGMFFVSRTPQSRVRGIIIDQDNGVLGRDVSEDNFKPLKSHTLATHELESKGAGFTVGGKDVYWRKVEGGKVVDRKAATFVPFTEQTTDTFNGTYYAKSGNPEPWYNNVSKFGSNKIARFCYDGGAGVETLITKGRDKLNAMLKPFGGEFKAGPEQQKQIEKFARLYFNAAVSYTPYFMMKTDVLSAEWDTSRMDMAFDRMLAGAGHLNWGEFKAGLSEVMRSSMREPFEDPKREALAQKMRWSADPEHSSNEAFQLNGVGKRASLMRTDGYQKTFGNTEPWAKKVAPATFTQLKPRDTSWAAQEAARKFEETPAQGQSVH